MAGGTAGPARHPGDHDLHDVVGVGLGPFNLGLAALLAPVEGVDAVFFEARPDFSWHPGLLLPGTTLQVPFLADLVTLADPTNPYGFLNYLHCAGRLYRFYFYERFHVPRKEYDAYCRWVAGQLPSCRFGRRVVDVRPGAGETWRVRVTDAAGGSEEHRARHVVFGVGSAPSRPACVGDDVLGPDVFHSADHLARRDRTLAAGRVTVVGSGQSAAEVFADLLAAPGHRELHWYTRSRGFLPMEYSKLGLEHFTPEYTAYFHGLPEARRDELRAGQDLLYKGIDAETSALIYDALYEASIGGQDAPVTYRSACELRSVERRPDGSLRLGLHHLDQDEGFTHDTDVLVLATGYEPAPLPLDPGLLALDAAGRPVVEIDYRLRLDGDGHGHGATKSTLFVQNGELHSHGVGAPDLGLGAHRNSVIVNALAGREVYPVRERNVFQSFGVPQR